MFSLPVVYMGKIENFSNYFYGLTQRNKVARVRSAAFVFILSHSRKNEPRITRVSNSVLMGKLNYPLPKNFASKILPIDN